MAFGSSSQHTGASSSTDARGDPILPLDVNGLYILLSDQGIADKWHWGLYLHRDISQGWVLHCMRVADFWFFEQRTSNKVTHSLSIIGAIKIAIVVDPAMQEALRDRVTKVILEDTARFGPLTCRTWVLRAVHELDTEGYISLKPGMIVEHIENEARNIASRAVANSTQNVESSAFSLA